MRDVLKINTQISREQFILLFQNQSIASSSCDCDVCLSTDLCPFVLQVEFEKNEAEVLYDQNIVTMNTIKQTIENLGYEVLPGLSYVNKRFFIVGMRCKSCVRKIEKRINEIIGIKDAKVNFLLVCICNFISSLHTEFFSN